MIAEAGAIPPLVALLRNGSPAGKETAAGALKNLGVKAEDKKEDAPKKEEKKEEKKKEEVPTEDASEKKDDAEEKKK